MVNINIHGIVISKHNSCAFSVPGSGCLGAGMEAG
jgi:hypothetical protein